MMDILSYFELTDQERKKLAALGASEKVILKRLKHMKISDAQRRILRRLSKRQREAVNSVFHQLIYM